jgi:hypothetical protein
MAGSRSLSYFQIGAETSSGTPVAATRQLYPDVNSSFNVDWGYTFHEGRVSATHTPISYGTRQYERVEVNYRTPDDTGISFDELPFLLQFPAGMTPTGSTAITWAFSNGGTAVGTATSYTVEFGDDVQGYEAEWAMASRISLSGDADGMTQAEADFFARQSTKAAKTDLSPLSPVSIPSYMWTVAFGTAFADLDAATAVPNFLREWGLEYTTGWMPHMYADGVDYFGQALESGSVMGSLRLVVDSNSTAVSQFYDKGAAGTTDFVRLEATGPTIAGGTARAEHVRGRGHHHLRRDRRAEHRRHRHQLGRRPRRLMAFSTGARTGSFITVKVDDKAVAKAQKRMAQYEGRKFAQRMDKVFRAGAQLLVVPIRKYIRGSVKGHGKNPGMLAKKVSVRKGRPPSGYLLRYGTKSRAPHSHLVNRGHREYDFHGQPTGDYVKGYGFYDMAIRSHEQTVIDFISENTAKDRVGVLGASIRSF